jgi:site-specific DNA-methyltransferase (adenine-specific)
MRSRLPSPLGAEGRVLRADAAHVGSHVAAGSAELAYLDPPFAVGVRFAARTRAGEHRARGTSAYDDVWPSIDAYIAWLRPRLEAVHATLGEAGTMWLHLDHRAVHEAKLLCDDVFGRARFCGEIVWVPGNGSKSRSGPGITHQTLLVYAKGSEPVWNARDPMLREPYAKTSQSMHFKRTDAAGRRYRERVIGGKAYRYYADEGRAIGSVWTDCPAMVANTPLRKEATGYPTQKPLRLLERIVRASSRPGALVIDPFCGSGTTLVAAAMHGRRFFGCDVGELAIETTRQRLKTAGVALSARR